jgi:energy-coupling factor transporter transmembrane protein EcfT
LGGALTRHIRAFLSEVAYVIDFLSKYNPYSRVDPLILFTGSLALTVAASFARSLEALVIPLLYSLALLAAAKPGLSKIARVMAPILVLGLATSMPLLFTSTGTVETLASLQASPSGEGFKAFALLLARVVVSPLPLIASLTYTGWFTVSSRLKRLPLLGGVARLVDLMAALIPRIARYLASVLLGRESRTVKPSLRLSWRGLATSIGETILYSGSYAEKVHLAITARSIGEIQAEQRIRLTWADVVYTATLLVLLAAEAMVLT